MRAVGGEAVGNVGGAGGGDGGTCRRGAGPPHAQSSLCFGAP